MVFRMLKGFRRLMLTTAMLFGVGLFLCGNEVKAAVKIDSATIVNNEIEIIFIADGGETSFSGDVHVWEKTAGVADKFTFSFSSSPVSISDDNHKGKGLIPREEIRAWRGSKNLTSSIVCSEIWLDTDASPSISNPTSKSAEGSNLDRLYEVVAESEASSPYVAGSTVASGYKIQVNGSDVGTSGATAKAYLFGSEAYKVVISGTDVNKYYANTMSDGKAPKWADNGWTNAGNGMSFGAPDKDVTHKFVYLPVIKTIELDPSTTKYLKTYFEGNSATESVTRDVTSLLKVTTEDSDADSAILAKHYMILPNLQDGNISSWEGKCDPTTHKQELTVTSDVQNERKYAFFSFKSTTPDGGSISSPNIPFYVFSKAKEITSGAGTTITLQKGQSIEFGVGLNAAADGSTLGNISTLIVNSSNTAVIPAANITKTAATVNDDTGLVTADALLKITAGSTTGSSTITLKCTEPARDVKAISAHDTNTLSITVNVVALDATKTKDAINNSERNFITVDHKLDLEAFFKDYVKDSSGGNLNMAPKSVRIINGSDYAELDGMKLKGKKAGTVKVSAWFSSTTASGSADVEEIEIGVFPNITAEYLDSSRTVKVKIPRRVATSYKDSKTISEAKGFTLVLEDSSGNTLYEYDKTKFQDVISNSSDDSKEYTISASDIESMVTNAASNGKFNNDTTSVKFRVVPRGYKPPKSDKDMTTADKDVNDSCSATVYRVTASGTNFGTTYAYGLSGQNVTLTASPNAGFTFKQWSDGNTSNPRTVTVSSSGTRTFSAVAGERLPGGTGSDNSQLYDDVPKTAESNSAIWLIVFMVFAVIGTTYALYLQLRAAASKNDK